MCVTDRCNCVPNAAQSLLETDRPDSHFRNDNRLCSSAPTARRCPLEELAQGSHGGFCSRKIDTSLTAVCSVHGLIDREPLQGCLSLPSIARVRVRHSHVRGRRLSLALQATCLSTERNGQVPSTSLPVFDCCVSVCCLLGLFMQNAHKTTSSIAAIFMIAPQQRTRNHDPRKQFQGSL